MHKFPDQVILTTYQREHSANITEAPKSYPQQSPPKSQKIITFDCRGLEFVEFKPDVRTVSFHHFLPSFFVLSCHLLEEASEELVRLTIL